MPCVLQLQLSKKSLLLPHYIWQFQLIANFENLCVQSVFYNIIHYIRCFSHPIAYFKQRYWLSKNSNLVADMHLNENAISMKN